LVLQEHAENLAQFGCAAFNQTGAEFIHQTCEHYAGILRPGRHRRDIHAFGAAQFLRNERGFSNSGRAAQVETVEPVLEDLADSSGSMAIGVRMEYRADPVGAERITLQSVMLDEHPLFQRAQPINLR
jgi:hypothetical protein